MEPKLTNSTHSSDDAKILGHKCYCQLHSLGYPYIYMFVVSGDSNQFSAMELSQDHTYWTEYEIKNSNFLVQPSVIRPTPSKSFLRAFFRDRRAEHIYSATSSDEGIHVLLSIRA